MPYETMMYAGIASTAVFLTISVVIFIQLDIRSVVGLLTGSAERKAIREMESNAASGKSGNLLFGGKKSSTRPGKTADIQDGQENINKEGKRGFAFFGSGRREAFYIQKEMEKEVSCYANPVSTLEQESAQDQVKNVQINSFIPGLAQAQRDDRTIFLGRVQEDEDETIHLKHFPNEPSGTVQLCRSQQQDDPETVGLQCACSDESGTVQLYHPPDMDSGTMMIYRPLSDRDESSSFKNAGSGDDRTVKLSQDMNLMTNRSHEEDNTMIPSGNAFQIIEHVMVDRKSVV